MWFVDTSVLVNLLDLDGFNQDKKDVAAGLKQRLEVKDALILPITAIIEAYRRRSGIRDVRVWSLDAHLHSRA